MNPPSFWSSLFGPDGSPQSITAIQMMLRALLVFAFGLTLLRLGGHRVLARSSSIDIVVAIVLGSILSRVVSGTAPTGPTLAAAAALVAVQRALDALAYWYKGLGRVTKGEARLVARDGRPDRGAASRLSVSDEDLDEATRLAGYAPGEGSVREVWLERDGRLSVIPRRGEEPRNAGGSARRPE